MAHLQSNVRYRGCLVSVTDVCCRPSTCRLSGEEQTATPEMVFPRTGVFAPWADMEFFRLVSIDKETGTLVWPGEIDLDPYVLYSRSTGKPIEEALDLV